MQDDKSVKPIDRFTEFVVFYKPGVQNGIYTVGYKVGRTPDGKIRVGTFYIQKIKSI